MKHIPCAAALLAALFCVPAAAQEGGAIIDRDRLDRQAPEPETDAPQQQRARGRVDAANQAIAPFVLRDVRVEGSSLPTSALAAAAADLRGRSFDGASLHEIADAVAAAYAEGDVALYTVIAPAQDFADGVVRLQVIEGHVSHITLSGETDGDIVLAQHYAAALTQERPLRRRTMERSLLLLSDVPGLKTEVRMAHAADPGGINVGLGLERRRFDYALDVNNRGSRTLGRTQLQASANLNELFRLGDHTRLVLGADAQFERFGYAALSHRQPVGHDGASVTGRMSYLQTTPPSGAEGEARAAGMVFTYPAIRSYRQNLILSLGLDGLNSDNAFLGDVIASERTRAIRAAVSYAQTRDGRAWRLSGTLSAGLDVWDAQASDPATSLDFTKLNVQAGYQRPLGEAFAVRVAAGGQITDDPLPASERFTLGGAPFGRAFYAAEIAGDDGLGLSGEVAWRARQGLLHETYVFADGGRAWREDRGGVDGVTQNLASAGVGARLRLGEKTLLDLEAAKALEEPVAGQEARGWALRWGLASRF